MIPEADIRPSAMTVAARNHCTVFEMPAGMRELWTTILFIFLTLCGFPAVGQSKRVTVEDHDSLTVYFPHFKKMDLVTEKMPGKGEQDVIFVCAASFTGERLDEFRHSNIAGHHVSSGEFFTGYKCGPYNGVFTWSPKGWHFYNYSHKNSEPPLRTVAKEGGMGFCQSMLFHDGKRFKGCIKPERVNRYRALCEIKGKLCIVDPKPPVRPFHGWLGETRSEERRLLRHGPRLELLLVPQGRRLRQGAFHHPRAVHYQLDRLLRLIPLDTLGFQALAVVKFFGLMDGMTEGDRPAVLGDLLQPGRAAVGQQEVGLADVQSLLFLLRLQGVDLYSDV